MRVALAARPNLANLHVYIYVLCSQSRIFLQDRIGSEKIIHPIIYMAIYSSTEVNELTYIKVCKVREYLFFYYIRFTRYLCIGSLWSDDIEDKKK